MPYFKYMSAFHLFFTSAPSLPAWFLQFSISIHSLVVLNHFSTQIIHIIIIIITQHADTPVVVWGVEWQVFVSRDRGHWPARALSCPLEEAQLTGPSGTTTLQPFIMNQDTARSPELTTIPIIAIMPRIHHPRVPASGQSCQRTFAKFHNARRRSLLGPAPCWKPHTSTFTISQESLKTLC